MLTIQKTHFYDNLKNEVLELHKIKQKNKIKNIILGTLALVLSMIVINFFIFFPIENYSLTFQSIYIVVLAFLNIFCIGFMVFEFYDYYQTRMNDKNVSNGNYIIAAINYGLIGYEFLDIIDFLDLDEDKIIDFHIESIDNQNYLFVNTNNKQLSTILTDMNIQNESKDFELIINENQIMLKNK